MENSMKAKPALLNRGQNERGREKFSPTRGGGIFNLNFHGLNRVNCVCPLRAIFNKNSKFIYGIGSLIPLLEQASLKGEGGEERKETS